MPLDAIHHIQKRKRVYEKGEPFPHPVRWKRFIDKAVYVVGIFGLVMAVPQVLKIWVDKNAAGVSVFPWIGYLVMSIFWLIYGLAHKEKPLILIYEFWILITSLIIIGTLAYS